MLDISKVPPWLLRAFRWATTIALVAAAAVHAGTYGPDSLAGTLNAMAFALFPLVFPLFGFVVVVAAFARIPFDRMVGALPGYVKVVGVVVGLYVAFDFFWMISLLQGPSERIDPAGFRAALIHTARLYTGHEIVFFGVAALVGRQLEAFRVGRLNLEAPPRDDALERSPFPYPLSVVVSLQTMLSPAICAERLLMPQPCPAWSLFDSPRGLRGQASAQDFRVELAGARSQMTYAVGRFDSSQGATLIPVLLTFKRWWSCHRQRLWLSFRCSLQ